MKKWRISPPKKKLTKESHKLNPENSNPTNSVGYVTGFLKSAWNQSVMDHETLGVFFSPRNGLDEGIFLADVVAKC